jgi:hypothetical protein
MIAAAELLFLTQSHRGTEERRAQRSGIEPQRRKGAKVSVLPLRLGVFAVKGECRRYAPTGFTLWLCASV